MSRLWPRITQISNNCRNCCNLIGQFPPVLLPLSQGENCSLGRTEKVVLWSQSSASPVGVPPIKVRFLASFLLPVPPSQKTGKNRGKKETPSKLSPTDPFFIPPFEYVLIVSTRNWKLSFGLKRTRCCYENVPLFAGPLPPNG